MQQTIQQIPLPSKWEELQKCPVLVINLERCPERYTAAHEALKTNGFKNIIKFVAVDGQDPDMPKEWEAFGNPPLIEPEFKERPAKQGCALSHLKAWLWAATKSDAPAVTIVEDDILFDSRFRDVAPVLYSETPKDIGMLFYGGQYAPTTNAIQAAPVICMHAYTITKQAAVQLLVTFLHCGGMATIDLMVFNMMTQGVFPVQWRVWSNLGDKQGVPPNAIRDSGFVFQNKDYPSTIDG